MAVVTCPACGSDDVDLVRRLLDDRLEVQCVSCRHKWFRGQPRDPTFLERPEAWKTGTQPMTPEQFGALQALHDAVGMPFQASRRMTKGEASAMLEKVVRTLAARHLEGVHGQNPEEVRYYSSELQRRLHRSLHAGGGVDHRHEAAGYGPYGDFL